MFYICPYNRCEHVVVIKYVPRLFWHIKRGTDMKRICQEGPLQRVGSQSMTLQITETE
jgi:hypothetical protein